MSIYSKVRGVKVGRSLFPLDYSKKFSADMGWLYPVQCDEVVPGDVWNMSNEIVVRFQPMVAPILHEVNVYCHTFFVPYRLLWSDWEDFITGGEDGRFPASIPTYTSNSDDVVVGSLWDNFGFPMVAGIQVNAFPFLAYNFIWNEYYRDQNLMEELPVNVGTAQSPTRFVMKRRCWEKDYFSSALPWQQRGIAPALPISGITSAVFDSIPIDGHQTNLQYSNVANKIIENGKASLDKNVVDLSNASTFDVSDLRLAFQVQKWLERNARGGARYTEVLRSHFAVAPRDDRLQRPEFLGGTRSPVLVSEVLQSSETNTTPQGTLAGHALVADGNHLCKYHVKEYGLIMTILSVRPKLGYNGQGVDRQWLRTNKYDYFWPEFQNLSEQAVYEAEIYATPDNTAHIFSGETVEADFFGFQGRYNEMRSKNNMTCGELRGELSYWHLNRIFDSAPTLSGQFMTCEPSKRIFAVQNRAGMIINYGSRIRALRPMVAMPEPGLIDHN